MIAPDPVRPEMRSFIKAKVPLSELIGYSTRLRSITGGEAFYSHQFDRYMPVGPLIQKNLIEWLMVMQKESKVK